MAPVVSYMEIWAVGDSKNRIRNSQKSWKAAPMEVFQALNPSRKNSSSYKELPVKQLRKSPTPRFSQFDDTQIEKEEPIKNLTIMGGAREARK